jgi:hypothetical protein
VIGFDGAAVVIPHQFRIERAPSSKVFADKFFEEILSRICFAAPTAPDVAAAGTAAFGFSRK